METKRLAYLSFEQNFTRALDFREAAAFLHKNSTSLITAFLLHQAAELSYRGILLSLNSLDSNIGPDEPVLNEVEAVIDSLFQWIIPISGIPRIDLC